MSTVKKVATVAFSPQAVAKRSIRFIFGNGIVPEPSVIL